MMFNLKKLHMTKPFKTTTIPQPQYLSVNVVYNTQFVGWVAYAGLDPWLKQFIPEEHVENVPCDCGCGQSHVCVSKENVEKAIELLKARRLEDNN